MPISVPAPPKLTQASQCVDTINVHRAATADTLSAASPERERRVHLVLDPDQSVQHHWPSLVQIEGVGLHLRLAGRLIGVPAVDVEGLDGSILVRAGLLDCAGLGWRRWLA